MSWLHLNRQLLPTNHGEYPINIPQGELNISEDCTSVRLQRRKARGCSVEVSAGWGDLRFKCQGRQKCGVRAWPRCFDKQRRRSLSTSHYERSFPEYGHDSAQMLNGAATDEIPFTDCAMLIRKMADVQEPRPLPFTIFYVSCRFFFFPFSLCTSLN